MVYPIHLLGLLFLLAVAYARFPEIDDNDSEVLAAIKSVYQTWAPQKSVKVGDDVWRTDGNRETDRKKRKVAAGDNMYCPEGYTGEDCEFPICETTNMEALNHPTGGTQTTVLVDTAYYSSCNISMNIIIDSTLRGIFITVTTNPTDMPLVHLINSNGNEVTAIGHSGSEWQYGQQSPGLYTVRVEAPSVECFVSVTGSSPLQISGGFVHYSDGGKVATDRIDIPSPEAYVMQPSTFIVHAYGLSRPGQIISVTIFQQYNSVARPQILLKRYGCAYEYFVETFYCREKSTKYFYRVDGIDFAGNRFRRYSSFSCTEPPSTPSPPLTTPDPGPKGCRNNGFLVSKSNNTTYCYCQGYFTGRDCGSNLCLNGGTRVNGLNCLCPEGFTGSHCENVVCPERAGIGFSTNRPTLIFVIRANLALKEVVKSIAEQVVAIAEEVRFDPSYLQHFALLVFKNNKLVVGYENMYVTAEELADAIRNITFENVISCSDSVLTAIAEAVNSLALTNRSPIYVITDAVPNDEEEAETIFHINSYRGSPIYVVYLEPPSSSGCTLDVYHVGYQAMVDIAQRTSGHVFVVPNTITNNATQLIYSHAVHTIYRSSLIASTDSANCGSRPDYLPIRIDRNTKSIVIIATGRDTVLKLTPPGTGLLPSSTPAYALNDIKLWFFAGLEVGIWGISITSPNKNSGPCSARIYSTRIKSQETTEYDLFWAYTNQLTNDGPLVQPIISESNALVAHINNYVVRNPAKAFAELVIFKELDNGKQEEVYMSNGIWRDYCDYQLYFPPLICHVSNEKLYFSVFIRDELGFTFQRAGVSYCSIAQPTMVPPSECSNGGVPLTVLNGSTICYCTVDWTGNKCEIPMCHNGGTLRQSGGGSYCDCTAGHIGYHCEILRCTDYGEEFQRSPINVDMAFVVELTRKTAIAVKDFSDYIEGIISDMVSHHPEWIANFLLATYNSSGYYMVATYQRNQVDLFVNAVKNIYDSNIQDPGCGEGVYVWEALEETMASLREDAYVVMIHASNSHPNALSYLSVTRSVYEKRLILNAFYAYTTTFCCNNTDDDFNKINTLCELNGGRGYLIHPSRYHEVFRMIPSYFMSSLIYVRQFADCTTPKTVYFPIDSYTQSIQLNVRGYKNQITIYRPDGSHPDVNNYYDLYKDEDVTGWRIAEIRRACDPEWLPVGHQYCALVVNSSSSLTWSDAAFHCHSAGASLINIIMEDFDAWINENAQGKVREMWIGLYRNATDLNKFYWDTPPYVTKPLSNYTKWDANEPSMDPSKLCVLREAGGKWLVQNCDDLHAFICMKHKYDVQYEPPDIYDDDLLSGKWWITVKTEQAPPTLQLNSIACMVEIRAQSSIVIYPVYTLNEHSDIPFYEPTTTSDRNRFMTHIYGDNAASILSYALMYDSNTLRMLSSATYEKRIACEYPWLSQAWNCPKEQQQFSVIHIGEDQNGVNFQRMTRGFCPTTISNCNHGISVNGVCVCDDYWSGKLCDVPLCFNGGTVDKANGSCKCANGFAGAHCHFEICLPQVPKSFDTDDKTLGFVFEMTEPNKQALQLFSNNFESIVSNISSIHPTWFTNYVAVYINSTGPLATFQSPSKTNFFRHLRENIRGIKDKGTECGAPLFGGLINILSSAFLKTEGSVVIVFTRSIPNDRDKNSNDFLKTLTVKKAQINYLVVDDSEQVCGANADNEAVTALSKYALLTGGNFFILPTTNFVQFLQVYLPALHSTALLNTPTIADMKCVDSRWYAQVDYKMDYVYITVFANTSTMSYVLDPQGQEVKDIEVLYSKGQTKFLRFSSQQKPGMYTIRMHGSYPSACSVQIRGESPINVWVGFTQSRSSGYESHMDNVTADPVSGVLNTVDLHVSGLTSTGRLTYTELLGIKESTIVISPLYKRQNCSYEFYSNTFMCPDQEFLIMINGFDDHGQNFRREVGISSCFTDSVS